MRLPNELREQRSRLAQADSRYEFAGSPALVLAQMEPLQEIAMRLLAAKGLIERDSFIGGYVVPLPRATPEDLSRAIASRNAADAELLWFLVSGLGHIPLLGPNGLKDRSKTLEYRYDAVPS